MASTYVNDLRLEEIATGEQSGTWGDTTNTNLELIAEAFSFGTEAITTNADTHTTTIADGATDPGRSMFLKYTGTLDSACTITIAPNTVSKLWFIENGTSGSQNIIISQGSGANITIPPGDTKAIYSDGAGSGAAMVDAFASLSVVDLKVQDDLTVTDDAAIGGTLGVTGVLTATSLDISGDIDVDGTTNLDAVDIDGAVQLDSTLTVGVDDTGYDVKFFGDTASAYMLWDASADDLILGGGSTMGIGAAPSLGTNGFGLYVKAPSGSESIVKIDTSSTSEEAKIQFANNGTDNWRVETNSSNDMLFIRSGVATYFKLAADGAISTPTAGTSNVRLGVNAGDAIASGTNYNVLVGDEAGTDLNSGDENVAVGFKALFEANSGSNNVAIGPYAMRDLTTGTFNIAIGDSAMYDGVVTGNHNTAIGYLALENLTGGIGNTAIGNQALEAVTVGNNSVAIGYQSFEANGASEQTGLGNFSGQNNTGAEQVFVGYSAGKFVTTGTSQTFVGHKAGLGITGAKLTGANNTAIGKSAGLALQGSAAGNTFLGKGAGQNVTTGDSNIILGNGINAASATADSQLNIGGWITGLAGVISFDKNLILSTGTGATNGVTALEIFNSAGMAYNTFGSMYSTGATMIGRGVEPKNGGSGYVASITANTTRAAIEVGANTIVFSGSAAVNTSRGDDVTMTERLRIDTNGDVTTTGAAYARANPGFTARSGDSVSMTRNSGAVLEVNRSDDGTVVNFFSATAAEGSISISGNTTSYNAFSGSHWSRLSDNSQPTILKGTLIENIDEMCDWYLVTFTVPAITSTDEDGNSIVLEAEHVVTEETALPIGKSVGDEIEHTYSVNDTTYTGTISKAGDNKHPKCKISDTADSTRIYGVFAAWDHDDDNVNDMYVTAVGTHVVRVHGGQTVSAGDLLVSNGDGAAKVQDDDIIRSKTLGKVLTNIKQETYADGSYTVPCALYCG